MIYEKSHHKFVDLCILTGTDLCPRVKYVGLKYAYDLIKEHHTLENIIRFLIRKDKQLVKKGKKAIHCITNDIRNRLLDVKKYFTGIDANIYQPFELDLTWNPPQIDELYNFMCVQNKFDSIRMNTMLQRLQEAYDKNNKKMQSREISNRHINKDINMVVKDYKDQFSYEITSIA